MNSIELFKGLERLSTEHDFRLFNGKKVGIDGNWLVKSLIRQHGKEYFQHGDMGGLVDNLVQKIEYLRKYSQEIIVVFSGALLPCQKLRQKNVETQRLINAMKVKEHFGNGKF